MTDTLTGPQKAAVLLTQADAPRALQILRAMSEPEAVRVLSAMASLPELSRTDVERVFSEFGELGKSQGSSGVARRLLVDRLGSARADEVLTEFLGSRRSHPLLFLNGVEPGQVAGFLAEEHPQTIAVVLAHLAAPQAAKVLKAMDEGVRTEVARRIATIGRIYPEAVQHLADVLEGRLSAVLREAASGTTDIGGVSSIVAILNQTDRSSEKQILADLDEADPTLAEKIRDELFVFDDIVVLDDRTLQMILRNVDPKELAVALKNASAELLETFSRNMSERAAADLVEEIDVLGPMRLSQVEAAQSAIVKVVRQLEQTGEIVLARSDEELV